MSQITFLNTPKLSGHSVNQDQDDRRVALVSQIEIFIKTTPLFENTDVSVAFFHSGASGLVSLLETSTYSYVLKVLLRPDGPQGEEVFLKAWEAIGVHVPHIFQTGFIGEHPYILMEYIPADTLTHSSEAVLLEQYIFTQMGVILAHIHKTTAPGYGRMQADGSAEYPDFKTWLFEFPQTKNQLAYIEKHNLLHADLYGSLDVARNILLAYIAQNPRSTYCHWDFAPGNILHTNPLTIFDPVPTFNHPYLDIARSIIQTIGAGYTDSAVSTQLITGYESTGLPLDRKVLHAAVLLIAHTKVPHWHKTNEDNILEDVNSYLRANKCLLDG